MKKLILLMLLLTSCGSETLLLKHSEIYIQQPITKIENMQWSDLYVDKDSVYHRYLYTEKNGEKTLILEISY